MNQGFVYILINPALPGYVKVGKTTKTPEERAKELSAATGVPTPFIVAYDALFANCDRAEAYVHALLEARGINRTPDREFFTTSLREAMAALTQAERDLACDPCIPDSSAAVSTPIAQRPAPENPVWLNVLTQAEDCQAGWGDTIQDNNRAFALYKQAARLGAPGAFSPLAEMCADRGDADEGLRWLMRGAENGVVECWADLAFVYMGDNSSFDLPPHPENAGKAWRRFFRLVKPDDFDPEGSRLYMMLRRYVAIIPREFSNVADVDVIRAFGQRFTHLLSKIPDEAERQCKLAQLQELLAALP